MQPSSMHYFPLAWPFFLLLILLFFVEIALIEIGILSYAYEKIGVPHRYEEFPDDHSSVDYRMDESLPFLAKALL